MTDLSKALMLVADAAQREGAAFYAAERPEAGAALCGLSNQLRHMIDRESARSAGAAPAEIREVYDHCEHWPACGCTMACKIEVASRPCDHAGFPHRTNELGRWCTHCGEAVPETAPGPAVPESGRVGDEAGRMKPTASRLESEASAPVLGTPQDGASPTPYLDRQEWLRPAAPSALQGELRACPFCQAVLMQPDATDVYWQHPMNGCYLQGAGVSGISEPGAAQSIAAWNRRTPSLGGTAGATDHSQLMRFYSVTTIDALIEAQARHVARLQEKLPKPVDQFPGSPRHG